MFLAVSGGAVAVANRAPVIKRIVVRIIRTVLIEQETGRWNALSLTRCQDKCGFAALAFLRAVIPESYFAPSAMDLASSGGQADPPVKSATTPGLQLSDDRHPR